jgi:hypothetical protein
MLVEADNRNRELDSFKKNYTNLESSTMANLTVSQSTPVLLNSPMVKAHAPVAVKETEKAPTLASDSLSIKKGVLPTLAGAGAGALAGGILAGASTYGVAAAVGADYAELAIFMGGGLGAVAGAVTGAIVANITDDKSKASLYGAAIGGAVGFGLGMASGNIKAGLTWAAMGAGAGVGGSFAGAAVAHRK